MTNNEVADLKEGAESIRMGKSTGYKLVGEGRILLRKVGHGVGSLGDGP